MKTALICGYFLLKIWHEREMMKSQFWFIKGGGLK